MIVGRISIIILRYLNSLERNSGFVPKPSRYRPSGCGSTANADHRLPPNSRMTGQLRIFVLGRSSVINPAIPKSFAGALELLIGESAIYPPVLHLEGAFRCRT